MTNRGAGGTRSYDVAKHMVRAGHQVHIICGIYDISGLDPLPWYRLFRRENIDGIDVTICNVPYSNLLSGLKRTWAFLWFAFLATLVAVTACKPDVVFATSTPLTVGIPGYIAAFVKRVPFVFEVRDIWPESFMRSGWVTGKELSIRLMARLESFLYAHAARILLVSDGFEKRLIERGLPPEKLQTILLGADGAMFRNAAADQEFLQAHDLADKKIAIFTGAHGKANGLDYILDAAMLTADRQDIAYLLIGEGQERPRLKQRAHDEALDNVVFADAVAKEDLVGILAGCHIGLMILKDINEPRPVTPNKIFDYMFVGLPSLVNFEGPTVDMVNEVGCGMLVDPKQPAELAQRVKQLVDDPGLCRQMGDKGRDYAWQKCERKIIAQQLIQAFEDVLQQHGGCQHHEP